MEMVALAKTLSIDETGPSKQHGSFSIDFGLVPALFIAVKSCRDRMVRREALGILQAHPRREGVWDGLRMAEIGRWIIDVEEEGLEGGFVPEYARVKLTKVEVDVSTKTARLECARVDEWTGGEMLLQTVVNWG